MNKLWKALIISSLLGLAACSNPPTADNNTPTHRHFVKLEDGSLVALNTLEEVREAKSWFEKRLEDGNEAILDEDDRLPQGQSVRPLALPPSADLRTNQTPIRNQGGRGTCTSFAVAALLEAAYKRLHRLELDLSEEWINGAQKMGVLLSTGVPGAPIALPLRETGLYIYSGGGVTWGLDHLLRYGAPTEDRWPYNNAPFIDKPDDPEDTPRVPWYGPITERQDYLDTYNLTRQTWTVQTLDGDRELARRYSVDIEPFPNNARQRAIYGPSHVVYAPRDQLTNLDWYKTQLSEGREIAFGALLKGQRIGDRIVERIVDGVWLPGTDDWGGHAMLMVGYNDARRSFLVKNSWGRNTRRQGEPAGADPDADGFIEMSYDWVTGGLVYEAAVVRSVRPPDGPSPAFPIGKWSLNLDGLLNRELSIYHLPKTVPSAVLRERFTDAPTGAVDRRLGTLHVPGAPGFRVNGETVPALRFARFWLLPSSASEPWRNLAERVAGTAEFRAFFFRNGRLATGSSEEKGLLLYQGSTRPSGSGVGGAPRPEAFAGRWRVYDDHTSVPVGGEPLQGELQISNNQGALSGVYIHNGQQFTLKISYSLNNPKRIQFEVNGLYGGSLSKTFVGYMLEGDTGVIVGQSGYVIGLIPIVNGFYATRIGN